MSLSVYHNTGKWISFAKEQTLGIPKLNIFNFLSLDSKLDLLFITTITSPQNENKAQLISGATPEIPEKLKYIILSQIIKCIQC